MQFCPICGTWLIYTPYELFCHHCGYKSEMHDDYHNMTKKGISNAIPNVEVLEGDILNLEVLPTVEAICEECARTVRAETWTIANGSESISNVTFYRCPLCGHTWRDNG